MRKFDTVEQALEELKKGKIILVTDDEDRENEGDFICAAEFATTENLNFMATHGKGLICMPMSKEICEKLRLRRWWQTIQTTMRPHLPYRSIMSAQRLEYRRRNAV